MEASLPSAQPETTWREEKQIIKAEKKLNLGLIKKIFLFATPVVFLGLMYLLGLIFLLVIAGNIYLPGVSIQKISSLVKIKLIQSSKSILTTIYPSYLFCTYKTGQKYFLNEVAKTSDGCAVCKCLSGGRFSCLYIPTDDNYEKCVFPESAPPEETDVLERE